MSDNPTYQDLGNICTCRGKKGLVFFRRVLRASPMRLNFVFSILLTLIFATCGSAQTSAPSPAASVWNALSSPAMDPAKSAHAEKVEIVRDCIHITLLDGTIQLAQPVNGVVFGTVFRGNGRLQADPVNSLETHQLLLFTKQDKLDMTFTDATFSFTDGFAEELLKQVHWQAAGPSSDDLYAKRQQEREDLGAEYLPRLFKSVLSSDRKRTAYFLADLKTKEKGWVEVRDDAMQPEEMRVGRWAISLRPPKTSKRSWKNT